MPLSIYKESPPNPSPLNDTHSNCDGKSSSYLYVGVDLACDTRPEGDPSEALSSAAVFSHSVQDSSIIHAVFATFGWANLVGSSSEAGILY